MSALTESFRLIEAHASALAPRKMAAVAVAMPAASGSDMKAEMLSALEIESPLSLPGAEELAWLKRALTRQRVRSASEERIEERLSATTHGVGFAASAVAVAYLITAAFMASCGWVTVASCGVYGLGLMAMYAASTALHAAERTAIKRRCQVCDHVAIYLLIAGTYTPLLAVLMPNTIGFGLLACVWVLAAMGIAAKVKNAGNLKETSCLPCVVLGWLVVVALKPLLEVLPAGGFALLVAGGVCYSVGVLFYCRDDKRYFHAIWHVFVMAGSACHYAMILLYVAG